MRFCRHIPVMIGLLILMPFSSQAQEPERKLTTFEAYAKKNEDQQAEVSSYVFEMIIRQTYDQKDEKRRECLLSSFIKKYGDLEVVNKNLGGIKANIAHAIKNPEPNGRVEYLVANYIIDICPRSSK